MKPMIDDTAVPRRGYYSVIQYCPDHCRLEAANIGVALFCPEPQFMGVRMAPHNDRIRQFFGSERMNWHCIDAAKAAIQYRLMEKEPINTVDDLKHFAACRANEIIMTEPRWCKVFDPELELAELYAELVE